MARGNLNFSLKLVTRNWKYLQISKLYEEKSNLHFLSENPFEGKNSTDGIK